MGSENCEKCVSFLESAANVAVEAYWRLEVERDESLRLWIIEVLKKSASMCSGTEIRATLEDCIVKEVPVTTALVIANLKRLLGGKL